MALKGILRHQGAMNKIARDVRLGPNRRLLAELISAYWSSTGDDKAILAAVILGEFVNRNGFKLYDKNDVLPETREGQGTSIELSALKNVKAAFGYMKKELQKEGFVPEKEPVDAASPIQS